MLHDLTFKRKSVYPQLLVLLKNELPKNTVHK